MFIPPASTYVAGIYFALTVLFVFSLRSNWSVRTIFIVGLTLRLSLLLLPSYLSTDIYRYLWEGHLIRNGINPYLFEPAAAELLRFHTAYWEHIEHKHLSAIYPPLAQLCFAVFGLTEAGWRFFLVLIECGSFFLFTKILALLQKPGHLIGIYWLLPIAIIEISWSGHLEGILVFLFLAIWLTLLLKPVRPVTVGMLLALATLIKYNALLLAPLLFFIFLRIRLTEALRFSMAFCVATLIGLAPYLDAELSLFKSLSVYLVHWRFNDSLFHLLGFLFQVDWSDSNSFRILKVILSLFWILLSGLIIFKVRRFPHAALYLYGSFLLCSAVVHPWYVLWFAPFLVTVRNAAGLLFCLLVPLSYYPLLTNTAELPVAIKVLEYLPVLCLLMLKPWLSLRRKQTHTTNS